MRMSAIINKRPLLSDKYQIDIPLGSILIFILFTFSFMLSQLQGQVIHRLDVDRFTQYRIDDWISYTPALIITSLDIDYDYVYFASRGGGILRFNKYDETWDFPFTTSSGLRSNIVHQVVYNAQDGFLYARTPVGIDVYRTAERYWQPSDLNEMPIRRGPSEVDLQELNSNTYRFPPLYRPTNRELPDFFTNISLTYKLDGIIFDQYNREFRLLDRIVDEWQRLWFGTNGFGPMMADMFTIRLESKIQSIPNIAPRDIFIDGDLMWIGGINTGTPVAGITQWDRRRNTWQYFEAQYIPQMYKDDVYAISGNDRYILFATIQGLVIYDCHKETWKTLSTQNGLEGDRLFDVLVHNNIAYVGSEFGFNWIDLQFMKVHELQQTTLDHIKIRQLAIDDSLVWAATRLGLYSINIDNGDITFYASRAATIDYDLSAIELIGDEIWIASYNGIAYWNRQSDEWWSFPGLELQADIRDIAATKNAIWFATNEGLLKYDRKRDYWRLFTEDDGLLSNDAYHIDIDDKHLWISTNRGICAFLWKRPGRID